MSYVVLVCMLRITLFGTSLSTRTVLILGHFTTLLLQHYITPLKVVILLVHYNDLLISSYCKCTDLEHLNIIQVYIVQYNDSNNISNNNNKQQVTLNIM